MQESVAPETRIFISIHHLSSERKKICHNWISIWKSILLEKICYLCGIHILIEDLFPRYHFLIPYVYWLHQIIHAHFFHTPSLNKIWVSKNVPKKPSIVLKTSGHVESKTSFTKIVSVHTLKWNFSKYFSYDFQQNRTLKNWYIHSFSAT